MGYNAFSLPRLNTEGPDIMGSFVKGVEARNALTRNALYTEEMKDLPARRLREAERFENEKKGWARTEEAAEYAKTQRPLKEAADQLEFAGKMTSFLQGSLASLQRNQYGAFYNDMREQFSNHPTLSKAIVDRLPPPESITTDEQFEAFRKQALSTLETHKVELQDRLVSARQEDQQAFQSGESEKQRTFTAGESAKSREHAEKLARLKDVKLSTADSAKMDMLKERYKKALATQEQLETPGAVNDQNRPYTQGDKNKATIRVREIENQMKAILDKYERSETAVSATGQNALAAPPGGAPTTQAPNAVAPQAGPAQPGTAQAAVPPTAQPATPPQRTGGERVSRLVAIHRALKEQGKDPMADPKVKAATEAFLASYPEAQADFERTLGAGGTAETAAQPQTPAQPGQNLTVQEFGELIAKEGWSPDRAAKEAVNMKIMDESGNPIDFESFKSLFSAVRGADQWTATYLKNAYNTYVDALSSVGNAVLNLRIPGTSGMRNALAR